MSEIVRTHALAHDKNLPPEGIFFPVEEAFMVAEFLKAELDSPRFKSRIRQYLKLKKIPYKTIRRPNIDSKAENKVRAKILDASRGFLRKTALFAGFPAGVKWYLTHLSAEAAKDLYYIDHHEWNRVSRGTRLVKNGVKYLRRSPSHTLAKTVRSILRLSARKKKSLAKIIVVALALGSKKRVVLEGHARITAYCFRPVQNQEIAIILGVSPRIKKMEYF